jgi:hypothetical protein
VGKHGKVAGRRIGARTIVLIMTAVLVLGAVIAASARSGATYLPPAASATSTPPSAMPPITVSGDQIQRDGQPWWFLGYNSFTWSGNCGLPSELMTEQQVDSWFASMRHDGHGAVRLFFFNGWAIDRLDAAVAAAHKYNIYLTITIANANGDCGEIKKTDQWFTNADDRNVYVQHMTMLLKRYKGDTAIAWFEYFNEPAYYGGALRTFYDEMGGIARSIDPTRLFSSGTIAPYGVGGDANFLTINQSPGVDLASLHEYDYNEVESHHGPVARLNSDGKPVIVGEFGVTDYKDTACKTDLAQRAARTRAKAQAYIDIDGYAGAFAWAWQPGAPSNACTIGLDQDPAIQEVLRDLSK